jgi:uncharacterized protein YuzE
MSDFNFQLFVQGNQRTGKIEAAYFQVRKGRVAETVEVIEGAAFVDYGKGGNFSGWSCWPRARSRPWTASRAGSRRRSRAFYAEESPATWPLPDREYARQDLNLRPPV